MTALPLLALLAAAPVSDRAWVTNWVSGNKVDPKLMPGFHGSYDWSSPHAADTYAAEAFRRTRAVATAGGADLEGTRKATEAMLTDAKASAEIHERAAEVLGWLQAKDSLPALIAAAGPANHEAIAALGLFGNGKGRVAFIVFGGQLDAHQLDPAPDPRATTALAMLAASSDPEVKRYALRALGYHSGFEVDKVFTSAAASCELPGLEWLGDHPIDDRAGKLSACVDAPKAEARAAALRSLGALEDRSRIPIFLHALDDADGHVFLEAHRALSKLEGFPGEPPESSIQDRALVTAMWKKRLAR